MVLGIGQFAHYLFHFLTGALQIIPCSRTPAAAGRAITPDWGLAQPYRPATCSHHGSCDQLTAAGHYVSMRIALRDYGRRGVLAMWPVLLFILAFAVLLSGCSVSRWRCVAPCCNPGRLSVLTRIDRIHTVKRFLKPVLLTLLP